MNVLNTHAPLKFKTLPTNNHQFLTKVLKKVTVRRSKSSYYKINARATSKDSKIF